MQHRVRLFAVLSAASILVIGLQGAAVAGPPTTTRVSVSSHEAQASDDSTQAAISVDGRFVAFVTFASNPVPNDTNGWDIFVRDLG